MDENELFTKLERYLPIFEAQIEDAAAKFKLQRESDKLVLGEKLLEHIKEAVASEKWTDTNDSFDAWLTLTLGSKKFYDFNEAELQKIREISRIMAASDEVVKNILHHVKNLLVGNGITCVVTPLDLGDDPAQIADKLAADTTKKTLEGNWCAFCEVNNFYARAINTVERMNRDGEFIWRLFNSKEKFGDVLVPSLRFVDPNYISGDEGDTQKLGVKFKANDYETITGLNYVDENGKSSPIKIEDVIFYKLNVDYETLRGVSSFFPIMTNLRRISKNLLNVSVLTSILSAIAFVRKHKVATQAKVQTMLAANSDGKARVNPGSQKNQYANPMGAGTILDTNDQTEYDFPAHKVKTEEFIRVIDKDLAHVAMTFTFPVEWLTSQEPKEELTENSPTVLRWRREQQQFYNCIKELFWKVQERMGVDPAIRLKYKAEFFGPTISSASALDQARVAEIEMRSGALSPQTLAASKGRDYLTERAKMIQHRKSAQPGEVMPGDSGNTNIDPQQQDTGQGGSGDKKNKNTAPDKSK